MGQAASNLAAFLWAMHLSVATLGPSKATAMEPCGRFLSSKRLATFWRALPKRNGWKASPLHIGDGHTCLSNPVVPRAQTPAQVRRRTSSQTQPAAALTNHRRVLHSPTAETAAKPPLG